MSIRKHIQLWSVNKSQMKMYKNHNPYKSENLGSNTPLPNFVERKKMNLYRSSQY